MEDFHCWVSTSGVENPPKVHKAIGHPLSEHKVLGLISSTKTERGGGGVKKKKTTDLMAFYKISWQK